MAHRAITDRFNRAAGVSLVLLLALAGTTLAQMGSGPVEVRINSVLAADTNKGCDSSLHALKRHLERLFHFSTYRLVRREDRRTNFGQTIQFDLPGGRIMQIQPISMKGDMIQMDITLFQGDQPMMMTDFTIRNGGILLLGGPRYEQGALIVSVEPLAHAVSAAAPSATTPPH